MWVSLAPWVGRDMAVFLINICKFNGCGITFQSLGDLIQHIEDTHIDYDPQVVEQKEQSQPACLPLSYVLRFITDAARKESPFIGCGAPTLTAGGGNLDIKRKLAIKHHSYSMSSSNRSNTPTGSEIDDDEMMATESEDSNDSWTTEEISSEFIMKYGSRHSVSTGSNSAVEKPFACPVPGCKKRYKNVNGIKYHSKNGHKKDGKVRKAYKCYCGKNYKTAQGLKNHTQLSHGSSASPELIMNQTSSVSSISSASLMSSSSSSSSSSSNTSTTMLVEKIASTAMGTSQNQSQQQQISPNSSSILNNNNNNNSHKSHSGSANFGMLALKPKTSSITTNGMKADRVAKTQPQMCENVNVKAATQNVINLGILTPATSPKTSLSNSNASTGYTTTTASQVTNDLNGNQCNMPLTPVSPNMKLQNFVSGGSQQALASQQQLIDESTT